MNDPYAKVMMSTQGPSEQAKGRQQIEKNWTVDPSLPSIQPMQVMGRRIGRARIMRPSLLQRSNFEGTTTPAICQKQSSFAHWNHRSERGIRDRR